ncbi:class I SAM-dependent methyltransferase [Pseudolysinimonas sp.]|uniref:class I SAM-dependent methyltransferase n=1 Tax=Pseudolysinimonas sp. TaxID=2680009 RepID=UPI00286AC4C3|nr:class I SAM-dependent methyltransferase [Pseudolysinimonas sp.]
MSFTAARSRNFGSIAELYERVRPGYPAEAVAWFLPADAPASQELRIADVGTGTGKLTDALLARGREITAVDPDPGMLAVLSAKHPGVTTVTGTAEQLPFGDATFDAVTFGQSWHWVDPPRGSAEVARILRPGGHLGLFWNIRDAREPWVAELADILGHQSADELMLEAGGPVVTEPFAFDAMQEFGWTSTIDVATLVDLAATHGFVITASEVDRREMLDAVGALGERVAEADGMLRLPYRLYVYRFRTG